MTEAETRTLELLESIHGELARIADALTAIANLDTPALGQTDPRPDLKPGQIVEVAESCGVCGKPLVQGGFYPCVTHISAKSTRRADCPYPRG